MGVQYVWKHRDRRELQRQLYVWMRMAHIPGWAHLLVAVEPLGRTFFAVELAEYATERDARDWSGFLPKYNRVQTTIEEMLATPRRFGELYIDGGIGAFLNEQEADDRMRELNRQLARILNWRGEGER